MIMCAAGGQREMGRMDDGHEALSLATDTAATAGSELALEKIMITPALATRRTPEYHTRFDELAPARRGHRTVMMGEDPALPKMRAAQTLFAFFKLPFNPAAASH